MIVYKPRLPRYCDTLRSPEGNIERTIGQEKYSFGVFKYSRKPIKNYDKQATIKRSFYTAFN